MLSLPLLDYLPGFFRCSYCFTAVVLGLFHLGALLAVPQHHIADLYRRLFLHDTTLGVLGRRLGVLGDDVHTFHDHLACFQQHFLYHARLFEVLIIAGDHHYLVAFPDIILRSESCFHFILLLFPIPTGMMITWLLKDLRCEGDDFHISFIAKLPGHGPEDAGAPRLVCSVQDHYGIVVEADIGAVFTAQFVLGANDHRFGTRAFFDTAGRDRILHRNHDLIANLCITLTTITQYADAQHFFGATVVRYVQTGFL